MFVNYAQDDEGNCVRVLLLFPDDPTPVATKDLLQLAAAIPLSRATLYRVLAVLVERGRIEKVGHGNYRRVVETIGPA